MKITHRLMSLVEQLGHFISCFGTFFSGVFIALIACWEVSLLALFVVPMILLIGATYTKKMNAISATRMALLLEATAMVEQVDNQFCKLCNSKA